MIVPSPYDAQLARIPVSVHTVPVLGTDTRYWEYGDPAATTTIVMVHGFRGDHHGLEPVVAQLAGYRILSPDLPGFGESAALTTLGHDVPGYSEWLRGFVSAVAPTGRTVILGHSFGSIIVASAVAGGLPADVVVLVNPIAAPALSGPRGILTRLAVFYYWSAAALPERLGFALLRNRVIVRVMSIAMAKTRDPALRRWIHNQHDRYFSAFSDRRVVLEAFRASVGSDVSEFAARIPQRTLLIAADKDDITPVEAQYRLRALFPDARLYVIPNVGHLIHYEVPAEAAEQLRRFLDEAASA
ncbi:MULTISPECIES: alpha/beta fold hydrolase [unclassified Cryobacterium]|uniref:alpha/beta fold hydrolase n=2 Tax=Bacteria TaxID=2 RepID=UPI00106C16D7|nr:MULTISPECIES: alpha/beta hydrolase [unclassified Cryobacterium]MDY7527810.1 alpha/beta hydrolase [Cryobacterium sp. 10C2]MDY7556418.1 alpha/beta hydrolase [Cryobacterium sp. 10C3]MEB0003712.1 alpha/beta hydrolase [Cryobacterium sp. RTC2.1]MEB0200161.1 alpha/beta hydrolase [Cryobacterium sp. 5I3]MEB0285063.1 alpha/beta hydrolase [Cryobacterium sp. 10S3]